MVRGGASPPTLLVVLRGLENADDVDLCLFLGGGFITTIHIEIQPNVIPW